MNKLTITRKKFNIVTECKYLYFACALIHIMMTVLFYALNVKILMTVNLLSSLFYILGSVFIPKKPKMQMWILLLIIEIIGNATLCNCSLGWGYGFSLYGIMLIPIVFYFVYLEEQTNRRIFWATCVAFIDIVIILMFGTARFCLNRLNYIDDQLCSVIFMVNFFTACCAIAFYSLTFINEMGAQTHSLNKQKDELSYRANFDLVTGVYNRRYFFEKAEKLIKENPDIQFRILCTDIKDFKLINDMYGDEMGNKVLVAEADLLRKTVGEKSVYGRISGDKFGICIPKGRFSESKITDNIDEMRSLFTNCNYHLHIYLGIYDVTDRNEPIGIMCDKAFIAIQSIKGDYQQVVAYYDQEIIDSQIRKSQMVNEFEKAISEEQFCIYLQPQTDRHGKSYGAEALVRWKHPEKGLIPPVEFIECFEEVGLIYRLDEYVWEQAAKQLKIWKDKGFEDIYISVNISPKDFYYLDIYQTITNLVKKYEIEPEKLRLELTETALAYNEEDMIEVITKLRDAGFIIEIDDFGSGYSSLNTLKDICADVVKIDREFLRETENMKRSRDILELVISLSNRMNMSVITEGVETSEQVNMLTDMGCKTFQGYYFSKPIPVDEFERKYM